MKLPFHNIIAPLVKPHLGSTKTFCQNPTFLLSIPYTYFYSTLGFLISANHLRKHIGEDPWTLATLVPIESLDDAVNNFMIMHDLKIIATSMRLVQYACLLAGCLTGNPSLFLPHLASQVLVIAVNIVHALLLLHSWKSMKRLRHQIPAIILMGFNWLQEFCAFRQHLCICDL